MFQLRQGAFALINRSNNTMYSALALLLDGSGTPVAILGPRACPSFRTRPRFWRNTGNLLLRIGGDEWLKDRAAFRLRI